MPPIFIRPLKVYKDLGRRYVLFLTLMSSLNSIIIGRALVVCLLASLHLFITPKCYAGDAATVIFESGQVVKIDDGFRQIVDAMRSLNGSSAHHKIVELNIGGGSFLLNVAEVVIVCRDACDPLTVLHQLDPRRGGAKSNVTVNEAGR